MPFPLCFNLRGNAGRNILIGPGLTELDFSVFKNNYIKRISETFQRTVPRRDLQHSQSCQLCPAGYA